MDQVAGVEGEVLLLGRITIALSARSKNSLKTRVGRSMVSLNRQIRWRSLLLHLMFSILTLLTIALFVNHLVHIPFSKMELLRVSIGIC